MTRIREEDYTNYANYANLVFTYVANVYLSGNGQTSPAEQHSCGPCVAAVPSGSRVFQMFSHLLKTWPAVKFMPGTGALLMAPINAPQLSVPSLLCWIYAISPLLDSQALHQNLPRWTLPEHCHWPPHQPDQHLLPTTQENIKTLDLFQQQNSVFLQVVVNIILIQTHASVVWPWHFLS